MNKKVLSCVKLENQKISMIIIPLLIIVTVAIWCIPIGHEHQLSELQEAFGNSPKPKTEVPSFSKISKRTFTQYEAHDPVYIEENNKFSLTTLMEDWARNRSKTNPYTIDRVNSFNKTLKKSLTQKKGHNPLYIDGNSNFSIIAAVESWPGDGSKTNPYTIAGLNITGPSDSHLIEIRNTDVYFRIGSCLLSGGDTGLSLFNVTNGQLTMNTVTNNSRNGIFLESSRDNTLVNNIVTNNGNGISLEDSGNITLADNTVTNNSWNGISLEVSGHSTLINNIVTNNGVDGIYIKSSRYSTLTNNTVINNSGHGILLYSSANSTLTSNAVTNNSGHGIVLYYSENNILLDNIVTNNGVFGQWLLYSWNGISLYYSGNITLADNTITHNRENGIYLDFSRDNTLVNNTVTSNSGDGISLHHSENNLLSDNTVTFNGETGIHLSSSGNNTFQDNFLVNNGLIISGDQLKHYLQAIVTNNSVNSKPLVYWQNVTSGIVPNSVGQVILVNCSSVKVTGQIMIGLQAAYCANLFIHNNTIINGIYGIHLFWTNHSLVSGNNLINHSNYGIYIGLEASNNSVEFNGFYKYYVDGSHAYDSGQNNLFQYNFWDDWVTPDNNTDGFVDVPYSIAGEANNQDLFPRVMDLAILFPNEQIVLSGVVTIEWTTCHMFGESVTYSIYYSPDGGTTWHLIESDLVSPSYVWDTTMVANGAKYLLKVVVTTPDGSGQTIAFSSQFSINNISLTSTSSLSSTIVTTTSSPPPRDTDLIAVLQTLGFLSILTFVGVFIAAIKRRR